MTLIHRNACEVSVPTATALVFDSGDPRRILAGVSAKHSGLVLPGGKIDAADLVTASMDRAALTCIRRELAEEIGYAPETVTPFMVRRDPDADIRLVSASKLRECLVGPLVARLDDDEVVIARYGIPDHVFLAGVDPVMVHSTEELTRLVWIDCRTAPDAMFSAGHGDIVRRYAARFEPPAGEKA